MNSVSNHHNTFALLALVTTVAMGTFAASVQAQPSLTGSNRSGFGGNRDEISTGNADPVSVAARDQMVDIAIVLATDVSGSMDEETERAWQRVGYAAAFRNPEIIQAVIGGEHGRIAVAYAEWGSYGHFDVLLPWRIIDGSESAIAFANELERTALFENHDAFRQQTSIVGAIKHSTDLLLGLPWEAERLVINVSGDGANNNPSPLRKGVPTLSEARQRSLGDGITINALPVDGGGGEPFLAMDSDGTSYETDIVSYYREQVIGGPGSFLITAEGWEAFPEAIRLKLWREIIVARAGHGAVRRPVRIASALRGTRGRTDRIGHAGD